MVHPADLAERRARAGADTAFDHGSGRRGLRGAISAIGGRADPRVAHTKIEDRCAGHDRNVTVAVDNADVLLFEVVQHAVAGGEAEQASARERDPVDLLDHLCRAEEVGIARRRCTAAHLDAAVAPDSTRINGAAGRTFGERVSGRP